MKKLLSLLLIICSIGVAYADDKSTVTSLKYVTDELNTRQDKFGANDGKAMTFTNTAGGNLPRDVKASLGTSTTDNGLPMVSAVNTGLENKQDEIGAANTNTVVTYTGTPGTLGQKGIYQDTGTYVAQSDNLIQASTFNAALRNGLENEFVCAGTDDGTPNGNCWLWTLGGVSDNPVLPSGYTQLEYITGGTFDTGLHIGTTDIFEIKYTLTNTSTAYQFGYRSADSTTSANSFHATYSGSDIYIYAVDSEQNSRFFAKTVTANDPLLIRWNGGTNIKPQINGADMSMYGRASAEQINPVPTFVIGGQKKSAGGVFLSSRPMIIYYFKTFASDGVSVTHNFVPVIKDSGELGMYDTVSNTFVPNVGQRTATIGPVLDVYIPQNQPAQNQ